MAVIYEELFKPLNRKICNACSLYSWQCNDVMNINPEIRKHGLPAKESWFKKLKRVGDGDDATNTPGKRASLHPTRKGHTEIYFKTLEKTFNAFHLQQ